MDFNNKFPKEKTNSKWYDEYPKASGPSKHSKTDFEVIELKEEAKKHLAGETSAYESKRSKIKDSEYQWLRSTLTQGTSSDKISATIVIIQENPKYNLSRLVGLVSKVKGSKHSDSILLIASLQQLFISDLLHPNYKLIKFEDQNLDQLPSLNQLQSKNHGLSRNKILSHWYFEDQLRDQYEKFVIDLTTVASDTVDANREKAIEVMTELLIKNSEQEQKLLNSIVNKIGDPQSKVSSKVIFFIEKILTNHPNMKMIVLREIEKLLFRPNVGERAQHYAICTLTQFVLDKNNDCEIATTMINVYFAFFKACLKKGEPSSKMMQALLAGVNRAYPYANLKTEKLLDHIDSLFKIVRLGSFNVSLNALSLLSRITKNTKFENRFYNAFYAKLLDPNIGVNNKRGIFYNLLFQVLKDDPSVSRTYAFIKRTLQVSLYYPSCITCAILYTISQILFIRKDIAKLVLSKIHFTGKKIKLELFENDDEKKNTEELLNSSNTLILSNVVDGAKDESNDDLIEQVKIEDENDKPYDPFYYNPLGSGAVKVPITELITLSYHFHPSVSLFAKNILEGIRIKYTGDPLQDLTLIRFLDRYVFRNPKKITGDKALKRYGPLTTRSKYIPSGLRSLPVNSKDYLRESEDRIPVDELYLYHYHHNKYDKNIVKIKNEKKADEEDIDDNESVNSEEFNELINQLGGQKDFEDLDIAGEISSFENNDNKKKNLKSNDFGDYVNDIDNDEEIDFDDDDFEENMSDIDLDNLQDDNLSDIDFNDENDNDVDHEPVAKKFKKSDVKLRFNNKSNRKTNKKGGIDENIFVSAEEFSAMLEKEGKSIVKPGSSNMMSDADGASYKQLDWEIKRNQKLKSHFNGKKRFQNDFKFQKNKLKKKY